MLPIPYPNQPHRQRYLPRRAGYAAARAGRSLADCPYLSPTAIRAWKEGFHSCPITPTPASAVATDNAAAPGHPTTST